MTDTPPPLEQGASYANLETRISRADQVKKLQYCDIDPDVYGDYGDITQLATDAIMAAEATGWSINGNVHVSQWFRPKGFVPLDTPITTIGHIASLGPDPRGQVMTSKFEHRLPDGKVPLISERDSLRLDAKKASAAKSKSMANAIDLSSMQNLVVKQLTPENVSAYSSDGKNLIHSDPATAKRFGFRAPIAGGLMGARMILGALAAEIGLPLELDIFFRFRRPMFWDDRLRLLGRRNDYGDLTEIVLINDADKVNVETQIYHQ